MKWTRIKEWSDSLAAQLARSFDNRDGFNSAAYLADNVRSGRFDVFKVEGAQVDLLMVTHTWQKSCYVLSVQGKGFTAIVPSFLAIMKRNGVELVIFDTERKGLLRLLCNRVDLQHLDGERYAFEVNNED